MENSFNYKYGKINFMIGISTIHILSGYKYLNTEQSEYVLSEIWEDLPRKCYFQMRLVR